MSSLQQQQDPGALYDFNLDEELEMDLDEETMEAMFGQDLASDTDILGMWIPEVLDWPTWVCVTLRYSQRVTSPSCPSPAPPSPFNHSKIHTCTLASSLVSMKIKNEADDSVLLLIGCCFNVIDEMIINSCLITDHCA